MDKEDFLKHYGVLGMKWGRRSGPRFGITAKRQEAFDRHDLEKLDKGGHLSIGFTKKRQAAYDKRDRAIIEKRLAKREKSLSNKKARRDKAVKIVNDFLKGVGNEIINDDMFAAKVRYRALQKRGDQEGARKHLVKTVINKTFD